MSDVSLTPTTAVPDHDAHHHDHPTFLAHHFETPEQQFISAKFGMWVFLATELLMFGGLFCAYGVYRHNHPEIFEYAHQYLNKLWGAVNTVVLITSSLTMAWAVRASQLGQRKVLLALLGLTIIGGFGFMMIKAVEYHHKFEENVWVGKYNKFSSAFPGTPEELNALRNEPVAGEAEHDKSAEQPHGKAAEHAKVEEHLQAVGTHEGPAIVDPNAGTADAAKILPTFVVPAGLADTAKAGHLLPEFKDMQVSEQERVNSFFSVYYVMTGLHGVHVVVGMSLIFWVLIRAANAGERKWIWPLGVAGAGLYLIFVGLLTAGIFEGSEHFHLAGKAAGTFYFGAVVTIAGVLLALLGFARSRSLGGEGEFGPEFFTPVDLVGLYWHLVDLIWIFLFPLLYLIV